MSDGKQPEPASVSAELARLGERELDPFESKEAVRALVVAEVEQLFDAAAIIESASSTLSPWHRHRAWRKIAAGFEDTRHRGAGRRRSRFDWSMLTLAAVAASAALVMRVASIEEPRKIAKPVQLRALAQQARASLESLPGTDGSTRAQRLAEDHVRQLEQRIGHGKGSQ